MGDGLSGDASRRRWLSASLGPEQDAWHWHDRTSAHHFVHFATAHSTMGTNYVPMAAQSLALLALGALTIHVILATGRTLSFTSVLCFTAGALIALSWCIQLGRKMVYMRAEVTVFDTVEGAGGARLWIRSKRRIKAYPGTYFYVSFPDLPIRHRFRSHLVPVAFWHAAARDYMTEFSLLIHEEPASLLKRLSHEKLKVRLDGPYGHRIPFGDYDLVMLVADGQGIVGVLPFVLSILSRNKQDKEDKERGVKSSLHCDKVRKVDLIWKLDCNSQVEWAAPYFAALAEMETDVPEAGKKRKKVSRVRLPEAL